MIDLVLVLTTEFTKSILYSCIKVVMLKLDQANQWLYGPAMYCHSIKCQP